MFQAHCSLMPSFALVCVLQAVVISNMTCEYNGIKQLFHQTMKNYRILKIERIQNPSLWKVFQWLVLVSLSLRGDSLQEQLVLYVLPRKERRLPPVP